MYLLLQTGSFWLKYDQQTTFLWIIDTKYNEVPAQGLTIPLFTTRTNNTDYSVPYNYLNIKLKKNLSSPLILSSVVSCHVNDFILLLSFFADFSIQLSKFQSTHLGK